MPLSDHIYRVPRYGDTLFLLGFLHWKGWPHLGYWISRRRSNLSMFWWFIFSTMIMFGTELFANSLRTFFRTSPGRNANGLIITLFSAFLIFAFNHAELPRVFAAQAATLGPCVILIAGYWKEWDEIFTYIWNPESMSLLIFLYAYLLIGLVKVYGFYFMNWNNTHNKFKKGDSIFYRFLRKRVPYFKEDFYTIIYEPLIAIMAGWLVMTYAGDSVFGIFLITAGICLFIQEFIDGLVRYAS